MTLGQGIIALGVVAGIVSAVWALGWLGNQVRDIRNAALETNQLLRKLTDSMRGSRQDDHLQMPAVRSRMDAAHGRSAEAVPWLQTDPMGYAIEVGGRERHRYSGDKEVGEEEGGVK